MAINWKQVRTAAKRQDQQQIRGRTAAGVSAPQAQTQISAQGRIDWDAVRGNAQLLDQQQAQSQQRKNAYEEAYEKYKQAVATAQHDQQSGYRRTQELKWRQSTPYHDQLSGYKRTQALKEGLRRASPEYQAAVKTTQQDQARGMQRTSQVLGQRIAQLEEQQADSHFRDYRYENGKAADAKGPAELQGEIEALKNQRAQIDKTVSGRVGEYVEDLGRGFFKGGFEQWAAGFEGAMSYLEQGANGAAAWTLRDLSKAIPDGAIKQKMLALADDFESYWTGESETRHEELARQHREELQKLEGEIADKYKGAALWVQQQMPSAGNMVFGAGVSSALGVSNLATLGVTAGGSAALEAKDKGATDAQALAYGVVAGGLEVFSEKLFGGNPIYDTDAGLVNKAVSKLTDNKTVMRILNSKAFDIASEGLEEIVTEVLDPVAEWAIYNGSNTEFADAESITNAFLGGVFLSVLGNVADAPTQIRQARQERVLKIAGRELADIADTVDSAPVQEAAQNIRDKLAYGVTPDAADIGAVLDAMNQAGEAVDAERVQAAVEAENGANGAAGNAANDAVQAASAENGSRAAENEEAFRLYNQAADARDAAARKAENARRARTETSTEAINDAEANRAAEAFENLTEEEVKGAADARARQETEAARTEAQFDREVRNDADRALSEAAARYGYDERMTSVLLSGYDGAQDAQQYAEGVNTAYEYGRNGLSLTAARRAAEDIDAGLAQEAWNAGKERFNGAEAGSKAADDGGKRDAGMGPGKQTGAVAEGAGGAKKRSAEAKRVQAGLELENRVRAAGQPYLSGKDIGLSKGSAQRSFREAPEGVWTEEMKKAAGTLRDAGFTEVHFTVGSISVENQRAKVTRYVDGAAVGDTVWVNATAKKWTVQQLANHEAFHRQVQDAPGLLDSVRAALVDELGEDGLSELAARYAEAYEGCYDAEELDAYIEEICADAYAGMDRLPEAKAQIIQKAAKSAQEAQQAAEENGGTRGPPEKYSINNTRRLSWKAQVNGYFNNDGSVRSSDSLYLGESDVAGVLNAPLYIPTSVINKAVRQPKGSRSAHALTKSDIMKLEGGVRNAPAVIVNPARNAVVFVTENADASGSYIIASFDLNNNLFGETAHKSTSIHGQVNLPALFENLGADATIFVKNENKLNQMLPGNQILKSLELLAKVELDDGSVAENSGNVNEKFSADGSTETPQENDKAALAYFGRTYKWSETGYVLLNGARLDFSGRHEGGSGGYRSVDHRDIIDALGDDYGGGDYTGGMVRFMQEGNIRISPESGGINLAVMPTKAQMDSLSDFISKERGEVILDIDDASGNTISSTEYPRGTHTNKVLQDIRNYFNDGTLPEVSTSPSVSQFRYSVSESDAEAEGATAFTLDSIPKKAQDYLRRVRGQTAAAIQQTLSMPFAARQEVLKPAIEQMMNEYLQTGRISQETIDQTFDKSYARGVELDTEFYDQYKDVKTRLRDLKVTLSEADRADIADFNDFRKAAFGRLRIANEGGLPVDVAYKEMRQMAPELFPASITHPADQLMQMFEVSKRIEKVARSLDEYHGENAGEFKRWAKNDYEASVENMLGSLRVARRYAEARMRQTQARAVPKTLEEVKGLYAELKALRRTYERAASKNLLTAEDNNVLNRLLRGELAPEDVQGMENAKGILAMYEAKADYDAAAAKIADWRRHQKSQKLATADRLLQNADQAKDKAAGIQYSRETMTRNVRDIFPEEDAERIIQTYFEPVRTASANANKLKNQLRGEVKALDLSRKARRGDAVSEAHAVQLLGEAQDNIRYLEQHPRARDRDGKTLDEWRQIVSDLWATSPGLDKAKIEGAVETFRKIYDGLFEQMNDVRIRNGYEPVNYRQGYFPHFQPGTSDGILSLMGKALGIDAEVTALPTTINGLTHTFRPGITYFGHALERIGFDTAYDAVEGFDKYVEGAASVICYTDVIQNLRALSEQVRYRTSDEGLRERVDNIRAREDLTERQKELEIKEILEKGRYSLSNFAVELDEYTNLLANKKSKYDRSMEHLGGRRLYNLMKAWENRVAANMVSVNPASWLTNFGVITQAGAQLKTSSMLKAMWQTLQNYKTSDGIVEASDFLTNRRGSDPLVRSWQQKTSAALSKPMEWIDTFSADTIVRARYMENLERGMSEETAMREADDFAANVMADRSKGAMPTLFEARNPITKMFTQFQLEVNNTFSYLFKDLPREQRKKGVGALAYALFKFLIGGFLYNEVYEYLIGRRPMLDPLGIVNDTVGDLTGYELNNLVDAATGGGLIKESEPESALRSAVNLAVNLGQELPVIGSKIGGGKYAFMNSFGDFGNAIDALDAENKTGGQRAAQAAQELVNPAAYWLLPFGGGQVKKVWQGINALKRQGSYTADGRLQYPIYSDREGDKANAAARTLLFGKSATPEAQAWVEAGFGALSEKATQTYEAMRAGGVDQRDSYELIKAMSKVKKTDDASRKQLQMQLLLSFDIEDSGKALYYYHMMASDKEKAEMDQLLAEGADMNEYLRFLRDKAGVTGEKDEDGKTVSGSKKAETFALINGLELTPEQKTALAEDSGASVTGFEPWTENHDRLYKAVSTGKELRSTLKSLEQDGYEPKELRAAITDLFREEYLAADTAGKARLKGYLRNAFMQTGLTQKEAESKIRKWEEAQEK